MSNDNTQVVDELAQIIQLIADVWPKDRENLAIAGAKFESVIESLDQNFGHTRKLANLAWDGIKHLYEKDDFFMEVKATTMQAINLFREFVLTNGDIKVEDFDKAYTELAKALNGGKESADKVITEEELESLSSNEVEVPSNSQPEQTVTQIDAEQLPNEVASVIQLLADVWQNDRENVAKAGAKFEQIVSSLGSISGQSQKLIDLAYQGMMHLYEKDDYFMEVKATTMQAVNLFREFIQSEKDVTVDDFEKAFSELRKALEGGKKSADTVISVEELEALKAKEKQAAKSKEAENDVAEAVGEEIAEIINLLESVSPSDRDNVALAGAKFEKVVSARKRLSGQLQKLSDVAYQGIIHLYQKDEYFDAVKVATIKAISIFKEFTQPKADVSVDDYESALHGIEKAIAGEGEVSENITDSTSVPADATMDDLSTHLMMIDESAEIQEIELLAGYLMNCAANEIGEVADELKSAYAIVESVLAGNGVEAGWLNKISVHIEKAEENAANLEWENSMIEHDEESASANETVSTEVEESPVANSPEKNKLAEVPTPENTSVFCIPEDIDVSMVGEFITECSELIESAESALLELEDKPDDNELVNTVFRAFHTIKGTSAFMGLDPITEFTHHVETVLSIVRDGDLPFDRACADINFESIDIIKKLLSTVDNCNGGDPLPVPNNYQSMMRVLVDVADNKVQPADALAKEGEAVRPVTAEVQVTDDETRVDSPTGSTVKGAKNKVEESSNGNQKSDTESSVRVSVNRLDRLIDMVGELVIAHSVVAQDPNIAKDSELQKKVNHATKILRELQDTSLTLRMVPLKATFHKMNRLVRDLSRKAGKKVKFNTVGEDTEIDRNMVDVINEPLIHMLRNSLDHGIETSEQRAETDKPDVATITLRAFQEGGKVVIQIQDDGRGINKDIILRKAIEKGLIEPDKKLTEAEIYGLIFLPGFSSAEKVTDLSGRGVGMDVVRRSIEELQGKIEVSSELGVGTTITIELPFTLAITDGMLIRVGDERFIVPTINIDMTFRAQPDDLFTVLGENEQVSFRGKSVPVIRLHRLFEIDEAIEDIMEGTLLVIKNNNDRYALLVDEVIGQQQLVGKSINMIAPTEHISGGAILGDGRVGLILDTAALIQ